VFWALNSLIIFSIALGTNQAGGRASKNISTTSVLPMPSAAVAMLQINMPTWPLKAFFANWLDGTVSRRNELLSQIQKIDEPDAEKALK
jgi:hypothetical protein